MVDNTSGLVQLPISVFLYADDIITYSPQPVSQETKCYGDKNELLSESLDVGNKITSRKQLCSIKGNSREKHFHVGNERQNLNNMTVYLESKQVESFGYDDKGCLEPNKSDVFRSKDGSKEGEFKIQGGNRPQDDLGSHSFTSNTSILSESHSKTYSSDDSSSIASSVSFSSKSSSSSDDSETTIISSQSSDESLMDDISVSKFSTTNVTIESRKLRRRTKNRRKVLALLIRGKGSTYRKYLEDNEIAAEREQRRIISCKRMERNLQKVSNKKKDDKMVSNSTPLSMKDPKPTYENIVDKVKIDEDLVNNEQQPTSHQALTETCRSHFLFELYHGLPCILGMICYCFTHSSIYELVNLVHTECAEYILKGKEIYFNIITALLGLFIARTSGGVWSYMCDEFYDRVKFDMENRLCLRKIDVRLLKWFQKHKRVKIIFDIAGEYLIYVSTINMLNHNLVPIFCDVRSAILEKLPSRLEGITTEYTDLLRGVWKPVEGFEEQDHAIFKSMVSVTSYTNLMGDEKSECVGFFCSFCFYTVSILCSIKVLSLLKIDFSKF